MTVVIELKATCDQVYGEWVWEGEVCRRNPGHGPGPHRVQEQDLIRGLGRLTTLPLLVILRTLTT